MKQRPRIAIYADCKDNMCGVTLPYMQFVSQFGDVVIVHAQSNLKEIVQHCDFLVVPGGPDVMTKEAPGFYNGRANAHYEYLDKHLLMPFIALGKGVIGICRGHQTIGDKMGATIINHIDGHMQWKDREETPYVMKLNRDAASVKEFVRTTGGKAKNHEHEINSIHHQAILKAPDGFEVLGDGPLYVNCYGTQHEHFREGNGRVVEAMRHKELPIVTFQYHPEEFNCAFARFQINDVIDKYMERKNKRERKFEKHG